MKILQVIPNLQTGGAEKMLMALTLELSKGNDVRVISLYTENTDISKELQEKGIKIYFLDKRKSFQFSMIKQIRNVIRDFKPDVIHTHLYTLFYTYLAVRKFKKIPIIHTVHSIAQKEQSKIYKKVLKFVYKRKSAKPVGISEIVQASIMEVYNLKKDFIPVIYNGIDLQNCIKKENYELNDSITFLHIGRLAIEKNHKLLISVFKKVKEQYSNSQLLIIGDGYMKDEIKAFIQENKLEDSVHLLGQKSNVFPYINEADMFLFTSNYEGMPMTLIEVMGSALPIVTTNVGGIKDMLDSNCACLIENDDKVIENFYSAVIKLIESEEERSRLAQNAFEKSYSYSSENMCEEYLKIYKKEIEGKNNA